jgi:choline dehydrogenase-like flavoprotein
VLERGGPVAHVKDYPTARLDPWDLPYGNLATQQDLQDYPIQSRLSFLFGQDVKHFLVKDVEHPYEQKKPFHWFRGYQVGGRSLLWSRHCFRWSDLDFEANLREGVGVDWPLRYADIAPWYDHVQAFIGISGEKAACPSSPRGTCFRPFEMNCFEQHLRQSIATNVPGPQPDHEPRGRADAAPQRPRRLSGPEPLSPRLSVRRLLLEQLLDAARRPRPPAA